jgi:hypothetical protein
VPAAAIGAAGGVPPLTRLLAAPEAGVQGHAVATLRNLVDVAGGACDAIAAARGIPPLVALLGSPSIDVQANALGALIVMCTREPLCGAVAATDGAIRAATSLLRSSPLAGMRAMASRLLLMLAGSATERGVKGATAAITASTSADSAGIAPLIELLSVETAEFRAAGCRALAALCSDRAACAAICSAGAQAALGALARESSDAAVRERATAALAAVAEATGTQ